MPQRPTPARVLGVVAVALTILGTHRANSQARSIWIDYAAGAECPSRAILLERILARTDRVMMAGDRTSADTAISISLAADGRQAEVAFVRADGQHLARAVRGARCAEVVDGAALVVAVTLDPTVATRAGASTEPPGTQPPGVASMAAAAPSSPPSAPVLAPPRVAESGSAAVDRGRRSKWRALGGIGVGVATGVAPVPAAGALFSFELDTDSPSLWAPAAFVTLELDQSGTVPAGTSGSARFSRVLGRLALCPVRLELGAAWGLRPCGMFEAGSLRGSPVGVGGGGARSGGWFAPGLATRVEGWSSSRLLLILDGSMSIPLEQDEFRVLPDELVHRVPEVAFGVAIGLGVRMP